MTKRLVNVRSFSHVGVSVRDLARSVEFYMGLFGFEKRFENREEGWARVGLRVGDVQLELFSPHPGRTGDALNPYYPVRFGRPKLALTVDDVTATYERLLGAGIELLCPVVTTPASKFFFIEDPDGTPIQLHEFNSGVLRVVIYLDNVSSTTRMAATNPTSTARTAITVSTEPPETLRLNASVNTSAGAAVEAVVRCHRVRSGRRLSGRTGVQTG